MGAAPDDMGHMSYIKQIVNEKTIPILNTATIDQKLLKSYTDMKKQNWNDSSLDSFFKPTKTINWIAQHPPLYYLLMAIPYQIGSLFTNKLSVILILIRISTTFLGIITLFFIYKLTILLRITFWPSCCILISFVFFSPIQYYFSNVTNDSLVIMMTTCALFYLLDYHCKGNEKSFYFFVLSSSLIVITKYTGIVLLIPFISFYSYKEIKKNGFIFFVKKSFIAILIGSVITIPWFVRNYQIFNNFFPLYEDTIESLNANISLFNFLTKVGYLDELFWHICGLMGGARLVRAHILLRSFITLIICLATIYSIWKALTISKKFILGFAAIILASIQFIVYKFNLTTSLSITSVFTLFFILLVITKNEEKEIYLFFITTIIFYFVVFLIQHRNAYIYYGVKRAIQGRYYYPLYFPSTYLIFKQFSNAAPIIQKIITFVLLLALFIFENLFMYQMLSKLG